MSEILPPKPNEIERIVKSINVDVKVVKPAIEGEVVCEVSNSTTTSSSTWENKTAEQILDDFNFALENMFLNSLKDAKVKDKQLGP